MADASDLVTLEEARRQCRLDAGDNDLLLETLITSASELVLEYIDDDAAAAFTVTAGVDQALVPKRVKQAALVLVQAMFDADDRPQMAFTKDSLPPAVTALLRPLRTPTLA